MCMKWKFTRETYTLRLRCREFPAVGWPPQETWAQGSQRLQRPPRSFLWRHVAAEAPKSPPAPCRVRLCSYRTGGSTEARVAGAASGERSTRAALLPAAAAEIPSPNGRTETHWRRVRLCSLHTKNSENAVQNETKRNAVSLRFNATEEKENESCALTISLQRAVWRRRTAGKRRRRRLEPKLVATRILRE